MPRDPLSQAAPILPQLDLTAMANQQGQMQYQINQQKQEKQKTLDADVISLTDKIRENNKGWNRKFGQANYKVYDDIRNEAVQLSRKYNDPTDPRYIAERAGITRKLEDMGREMALQKDVEKWYDKATKTVETGKDKISSVYKNKLYELYQLPNATAMTDFINDPENIKIFLSPFKPTPLDINKNVKEIEEGITRDAGSAIQKKDENGNILTYTSQAYKSDVLNHIRQRANDLYEQVKNKNYSIDDNTEKPITYGEKFKNNNDFYNYYFKDHFESKNKFDQKLDKKAFNMSFGGGSPEHGYTPSNKNVNFVQNGKTLSMDVEQGLTITNDDAVAIPNIPLTHVLAQSSNAEDNLEDIKKPGNRVFNPDYVFRSRGGTYWVSGTIKTEAKNEYGEKIDAGVYIPYNDIKEWLNPNLTKAIDGQQKNSSNQNTKSHVGESGVPWKTGGKQ